MSLEIVMEKFGEYHIETKNGMADLKGQIDSLDKYMQTMEGTANRLRLGGGGGGEQGPDTKAVGAALRLYIKSGQSDLLDGLQTKDMSVGSDPGGGYTVFPHFSAAITKKVFELSPIRALARTIPIATDAFEELLDLNELESGWVGEKAARPDTASADIGKLRIPVCEVYAMPKVTQKLLDDSAIDIGAWLVEKISTRLARLEGLAFVSGDGILQPRGFLTYSTSTTTDATRTWGELQYVASGAAGDFAASNPADALIDLQTELKSAYRPNATWIMNRRTAGKVKKFKDGMGEYIWQRGLVAGQPDALLGHPVVLAEDMSDVGANAYPIAFGDFRAGYTIVDRHGDRLLRDPFTDKPNVRFYTYRRVGGDVNNFEAIKLLKIAAA